MRRATGILLAILVLAGLAVSACSDDSYRPGISVDELVARSLAAQSGVTTYRFDMFQVFYTYGQQGILMQEYSVSDNAVGVVDEANHRMAMDMSVTVQQSGRDPQTTEVRAFLISDNLFTGTLSTGQQWTWQKQALGPGSWNNQTALDQSRELLEGSRRKLVREEEVNGVECYVVELTPDVDQFWERLAGSLTGDASSLVNSKEAVTGLGATQWIARDTHLLAKMAWQANLHLAQENMDMVILVEMAIHHINEPVDITLPPEAAV